MQGPRRSFLHVNRCLYRGFSSASAGNLSVFCPGKIWLCRFPSTCPPVFFVGNTLQNLPAERKNTQHKETEKAYSRKVAVDYVPDVWGGPATKSKVVCRYKWQCLTGFSQRENKNSASYRIGGTGWLICADGQ